MPAHRFTGEVRDRVLEALTVGSSRRTAAAVAGIDEATLRRWMARGKDAAEGTAYREFHEAVTQAEAHPRVRALGIIYKEMPDRPDLAWKFIERREPGYAPPMPNSATAAHAVTVIQLAFADGSPMAPAIEGVVIEQESPALGRRGLPAPRSAS